MTSEGQIIKLCVLTVRQRREAVARRLTGIGTSVSMDDGR